MPFTAAHPALVLPLLSHVRVPYASSALIMGAMAPDFEYFLRLRPLATMGHSLWGLFTFCLPLGLLVLLAYQLWVKRPLALLMPAWIFSRLGPVMQPQRLKLRDVLMLAVLLWVGAASHLLWDGLTHRGGWALQLWPGLGQVLFQFQGLEFPVFKLLQHASGLLGLLALAWAAARWLGRQTASTAAHPWSVRQRCGVLAAMAAAALVFGLGVVLADAQAVHSAHAAQVFVVRFAVATITGLAVAALVFGLLITALRQAPWQAGRAPHAPL